MYVPRTIAARHLVGSVRYLLAALVCAAPVALSAHAATAAPKPTPAAAPTGGIGLRLVDAPASGRADPRASMYIVDHLRPGTVIHRKIEVTNGSAATAHVALYAAAAAIADGTFMGAAGPTPNDLSTWTSVSPSGVDVPADGRVTMTVTIAVPRDAAPGEQYAVVWAEARSAPSAGDGLTQVSRVGIRLYLSIGPGGPPPADFVIESLTAARSATGQPMILATVRNSGGRALDMNGTLDLLRGPGGLSAGPFTASLAVTLAVGAVGPVTIVLDRQLPAGPWQARIKLRSGLIERSAVATISFPFAGTAPAVNTRATVPAWRYLAVAGLVVLLLAVVAGLVVRRRRPAPRHSRKSSSSAGTAQAPVIVAKSPVTAPLVPAAEPVIVTEPVVLAAPMVADPPAPRHERRRPVTDRPSRLSAQPVTVDAVTDAPYHCKLALPYSQDALTGLADRSLFEDETQIAIDTGVERLCLLRISLDEYDEISRVHGREVGDELLVVLAERLRNSVRPKDLTGRLDALDFAVLFEDVRQPDIDTIAQRILTAVREPFAVAGHQVFVRASVGIAAAAPTDDAVRLLMHATDALAFARITAGAEHQWYVDEAAPTPA